MATPEPVIDEVAERAHQKTNLRQLWQTIGATKLANQVAASLSSQALHAMEDIRDRKLYLSEGYQTFDEFLDRDPDSPMSHDTFRRRINLLKSEGEAVFDLLTSLNVPFNQRKLLAGEISVEGNEIQIGDAKCRLDDEAAVITLISKQHAKLQEQQRTIERGKKDIEKHKQRVIEAERRATVANPTGTPTGQALLTAAGALTQLCEALADATPEEKTALTEPIFDLMSTKQLDLSVALGIATKEEVSEANTTDDDLVSQ